MAQIGSLEYMASFIPMETRTNITNVWLPNVVTGKDYQSNLQELFNVYNEYIYGGQDITCAICRTKVINQFQKIIKIWTRG